MVSGLATIYLGSRWGFALAVLTPFASCFLSIGDAPFYVYMPADLSELALYVLAFRFLSIDRKLSSLRSRSLYLVFAIALPSFIGGSVAALVRAQYPGGQDLSMLAYAWNWMLENLVPAIILGPWLHKIVGETYEPFAWESGRKPRSWVQRSLDHSAPWLLGMAIVGVMVVAMLVELIGWERLRAWAESSPGGWNEVRNYLTTTVPILRPTALALLVALLYALGCSVRFAKQAWALTEAVRRYFPNNKVSDLLLSGINTPLEHRFVTVMVVGIHNFTTMGTKLAPAQLIVWLNRWYNMVSNLCTDHGGCVEKFVGDALVLIFGLQANGPQTAMAVSCAIDIIERLTALNAESMTLDLPAIEMGIGIHTGPTIAGSIGSQQRRQYVVLGSTVETATSIQHGTEDRSSQVLPIILSMTAMRESGLLLDAERDGNFLEVSLMPSATLGNESFYFIQATAAARIRQQLNCNPLREGLHVPDHAGASGTLTQILAHWR